MNNSSKSKVQSPKFKVQSSKSKVQSPKSKVQSSRTQDLGLGTWDSQRGLTLIEVLLAMVILGIGLTVLVSSASKCLAIVRKARAYSTAHELLARVELEHPIKLDEIENANDSGGFDGEYAAYRWTRKVELVGLEEDGLYELRTRVQWAENRQEVGEELVTYIYAPEDLMEGSFESPE